MKISAIDIGSNSVRLAFIADGKTLYKRLETTRLGEGIFFTGKLKEEAIERSAQAVKNFFEVSKRDGAEKVYAFATAAVRSSVNGQDFVNRVKELCGLTVDVLSGEEEAQCGILGALKGKDGGIIDVGGASTEVTVRDGGSVYTKSVNIGTVRLYDAAGRDKEKLLKFINEKLEEYGNYTVDGRVKMCAIGGTATTIASVKLGLKNYDPAVIDGTAVTADEVTSMADRLLSLSVGDVKKVAGMEPRRADVIGGGCLLMAAVMKNFGIREIAVSESDNLEGYILLREGL